MRIRKHANISQLLYATSSLKPVQTHINCQLNQSPWDVITFSPPSSPPPPPPSQLDIGDYINGQNVSSVEPIPVYQRKFSGKHKEEYSGGGTTTDKAEQLVILCGKTDGKSWQCRKEAAEGNSLCEHHLSQTKNYNYSNHSINNKSENLVGQAHKKPEKSVGQRPTRPRKAPSSSNTHEFYYYSGFGPRWGKKRGGVSKNDIGSSMPKNVDNDQDELDSSMSYEFDEEIDYEDEENEVKRKKKARKPIKERSLKSLM